VWWSGAAGRMRKPCPLFLSTPSHPCYPCSLDGYSVRIAMWCRERRARAHLGMLHTYGSWAAPMSHLHLLLHQLFVVVVPDVQYLCPTFLKAHMLIQRITVALTCGHESEAPSEMANSREPVAHAVPFIYLK
jgi:hypothetical protein